MKIKGTIKILMLDKPKPPWSMPSKNPRRKKIPTTRRSRRTITPSLIGNSQEGKAFGKQEYGLGHVDENPKLSPSAIPSSTSGKLEDKLFSKEGRVATTRVCYNLGNHFDLSKGVSHQPLVKTCTMKCNTWHQKHPFNDLENSAMTGNTRPSASTPDHPIRVRTE